MHEDCVMPRHCGAAYGVAMVAASFAAFFAAGAAIGLHLFHRYRPG